MPNELTWEAEEFEYRPKSNDWYWAVGIIAAGMAIFSIIFENILFAIFIIIASFSLVMQSTRKSAILSVKIDPRGIVINKTLYPFNTLEAFWVEKTTEADTLLLRSSKAVMPYIVVPIQNIDSVLVESFVAEFLPEEEMHEPLAQKIMERLGF